MTQPARIKGLEGDGVDPVRPNDARRRGEPAQHRVEWVEYEPHTLPAGPVQEAVSVQPLPVDETIIGIHRIGEACRAAHGTQRGGNARNIQNAIFEIFQIEPVERHT